MIVLAAIAAGLILAGLIRDCVLRPRRRRASSRSLLASGMGGKRPARRADPAERNGIRRAS